MGGIKILLLYPPTLKTILMELSLDDEIGMPRCFSCTYYHPQGHNKKKDMSTHSRFVLSSTYDVGILWELK